MEKITWEIKTINKYTHEPLRFEVVTLGDHPEIARNKAIVQLTHLFPDKTYYLDEVLVVKKETQLTDLGTPYGGA